MFARAELLPHPAAPAPAVVRVTAGLDWTGRARRLVLRYRVEANLAALRLPARSGARRTDGLWQHTCFEAFLKPDDSDAYLEFNFSPSGAWAAYRFAGRRSGMQPLADCIAPSIETGVAGDLLETGVRLEIPAVEGPGIEAGARVGLAAVLEDLQGRRSFWALAHAADVPDFHDPGSFTLRLAPRVVSP